MPSNLLTHGVSKVLEVKASHDGKGQRLTVTKAISAGQVFHKIENYHYITEATFSSVQVGQAQNIEEFKYMAYLNHSCDPNIILDTLNFELRAIRDIAPGEELSFFYPSTEWSMSTPFKCLCGAPQCLGYISGAKHLSLHVISKYFCNHHIRMMAMACVTHDLAVAPAELITAS